MRPREAASRYLGYRRAVRETGLKARGNFHGGADFLVHLVGGDDLLAVEVATAFRGDLVFELHRACAGLFQDAHRSADGKEYASALHDALTAKGMNWTAFST